MRPQRLQVADGLCVRECAERIVLAWNYQLGFSRFQKMEKEPCRWTAFVHLSR